MNYIFVFLGEFGYEILNWQGAIRKFSKTINKNKDKITVCTRKGLQNFYEFADSYIDISELKYFKNSAANMYWSHNPDCNIYKKHDETIEKHLKWELMSRKDKNYQNKMKKEIKNFVFDNLNLNFMQRYINKNYKIIFSSDYQVINGIKFGSPDFFHPFIYNDLDINNNDFIKISANPHFFELVEKKLGFNLNEKFILCQTGARKVVQRSKQNLEYEIIKKLAEKIKIVLLNFDTGRNLDSHSEFKDIDGCFIYNCSSFEEQSVLIEKSKECLFFTSGDFRSHNYLPPFMGKNVYSIAPKDVFELGTTPIEFWNKNVFKFGGQIIPIFMEEIEKYNLFEILLNNSK